MSEPKVEQATARGEPTRPPRELDFGDILRTEAAAAPRTVPPPETYHQYIGLYFMAGLLLAIGLAVMTFLLGWWVSRPTPSDLMELVRPPAAASPPDAGVIATLTAEAQKSHGDQWREMFQLLVLSCLMPLFTLMAGYVFGERKGRVEGVARE